MNEFMLNPTRIDRPRSIFPIQFRSPTTMRVGDIVPLMCKEVLPGSTFSLDCSSVLQAASPFVSRVYGDLFLDLYAFFVPNRLVWEHWQQFCGENDTGAWTQTTDYTIPTEPWDPSVSAQCLGDYFGLPFNSNGVLVDVSELPLRGYYRIYNEFFRNENTDVAKVVTYGDGKNTAIDYEDQPLQACRFPDYFSMALPGAQKGGAVMVPLGSSAPIVTSKTITEFGNNPLILSSGASSVNPSQMYQVMASPSGSNQLSIGYANASSGATGSFTGSNLVADLSAASAATINQWRLAFQTQKYLELMARGGSRYIESLKSLFGVTNGDARLQRCEYLGGKRIPIQFQEVVATSSSSAESQTQYALGQQVIKSVTHDSSSLFTKSFSEHGYLHVYGVIRQRHQYSQGLERHWTRKKFLDLYNPIFDTIGETPVYNREIFYSGSDTDNEAFGYQEAWAEYRYDPDRITGYLRPDVPGGLSSYSFADKYQSTPTLNGFMHEDRSFVTRTMALDKQPFDFICDFYFSGKKALPMSLRSIPGLIDHH